MVLGADCANGHAQLPQEEKQAVPHYAVLLHQQHLQGPDLLSGDPTTVADRNCQISDGTAMSPQQMDAMMNLHQARARVGRNKHLLSRKAFGPGQICRIAVGTDDISDFAIRVDPVCVLCWRIGAFFRGVILMAVQHNAGLRPFSASPLGCRWRL